MAQKALYKQFYKPDHQTSLVPPQRWKLVHVTAAGANHPVGPSCPLTPRPPQSLRPTPHCEDCLRRNPGLTDGLAESGRQTWGGLGSSLQRAGKHKPYSVTL